MIFANCDYVFKTNLFGVDKIYFTKLSEYEIVPISIGYFDINRYIYMKGDEFIQDIFIWDRYNSGLIQLENKIYFNDRADFNSEPFKNNVLFFQKFRNDWTEINSLHKWVFKPTFYTEYKRIYEDNYTTFYIPMNHQASLIKDIYTKVYNYKSCCYRKTSLYYLLNDGLFVKIKEIKDNKFQRIPTTPGSIIKLL